MRTLTIAAVWAVLASIPLAAAAAKEPIPLERKGPWTVNYDEDACHLIGAFGEGDAEIAAKFTRYQPGDLFNLDLYGKALKSSEPFVEVTLDFGPVANPRETSATVATAKDLGVLILGAARLDDWQWKEDREPPPITPEQEALVTEFTFRLSHRGPYRLILRSMGPPMRALRTCSENLVRHWGYDPVEQAARRRSATPKDNPAHWATSADFPPDMLAKGANGIVQFRLDVDAQGTVAGCHIQQATRPAGYADQTCRLMRLRAKFLPALDKDGRPIASYYVNTVRWVGAGG